MNKALKQLVDGSFDQVQRLSDLKEYLKFAKEL